jgi:drug/metabolite transporter (DMT)-like permease
VAASFYLVPGVVALLSWWLLGETLTPLGLGGLALASLGVWLTQAGPRAPAGGPDLAR